MSASLRIKTVLGVGLGSAAILLAGCASVYPGKSVTVTLSGGEEVPPVSTAASGSGIITVAPDFSVSGVVNVAGISPFAGHIHIGARGKNGPIAVGLAKTRENEWSVPAGASLNDAQYRAFYAGELYINLHTEANKGGEIRGQLQP